MRYGACLGDVSNDATSPTYNFERYGYQYNYFIYNVADTITMLCLASLVVPVISVVKLMLPNSKIFTNSDHFIKSRTLIQIINFTYMKVAFTAMLNFSHTNPHYMSSAFNSFSSIVAVGYLILVPIFYFVHSILFFRELKQLKKKLEYF
jgi:hypothetical protein